MKKTLLFEAAGTIEAPVERVERLMLAVRPGPVGPDNAWLMSQTGGTIEGGPERFTLRRAGHAMTVEVVGQTFAMQGGWWYRGSTPSSRTPQERFSPIASSMSRAGGAGESRWPTGFSSASRRTAVTVSPRDSS